MNTINASSSHKYINCAATLIEIAEQCLICAKCHEQACYAFHDAQQAYIDNETHESCLLALRSLAHSRGIDSPQYIAAACMYRDTYNQADPFNVVKPAQPES